MNFLEIFQDHTCYLCREKEGAIPYLCPQCWDRLDFQPGYRQKNGRAIYTGFSYTGSLRKILTDYKFESKTYLAKTLAHLFIQVLGSMDLAQDLDGFVVVPSAKQTLKKRGFDPMDLIGMEIHRLSGLSYYRGKLEKIKNTPLQLGLSAKEREVNLVQAFRAKDLEGKNILLLDDILTTGSTLYQASLALEEAGVNQVYPVSLSA